MLLGLLAPAAIGLLLAGCDSGAGVSEAPVAHDPFVGGHGAVGGAAGPDAPGAKTPAKAR